MSMATGHMPTPEQRKIAQLEKECAALRAELDALKAQGPVRERAEAWLPLYLCPVPASVPKDVTAALHALDDYIARIEGNDRGACGSINILREYFGERK